MLVIDIPEDKDPIGHVWGDLVPGIGPAASHFSLAVYEHTTLGLREFEAARLRSGARPGRSTSAPGSPRSTPSATPSTTTGWTRASGRG